MNYESKKNHLTPKFAKVVSDKSNTSNCYKKFILAKRSDVKLECSDPEIFLIYSHHKWSFVSTLINGASCGVEGSVRPSLFHRDQTRSVMLAKLKRSSLFR